MARQQYMKEYAVFHKSEAHKFIHTTVCAKSASEARYSYYLDVLEPWPDVRYIDIRSKMVGVLYPVGGVVPVEERKQLEILRHALGLKDPIGEGESYRNYFASGEGSTDWDTLQAMCNTVPPLMSSRNADALAKGMVYFNVTTNGLDFVRQRRGMSTVETRD